MYIVSTCFSVCVGTYNMFAPYTAFQIELANPQGFIPMHVYSVQMKRLLLEMEALLDLPQVPGVQAPHRIVIAAQTTSQKLVGTE